MEHTPEVGEPFSWEPAAFTEHCANVATFLGATSRINGRIVYVNEAHRYFRVEGRCEAGILRECFKF